MPLQGTISKIEEKRTKKRDRPYRLLHVKTSHNKYPVKVTVFTTEPLNLDDNVYLVWVKEKFQRRHFWQYGGKILPKT